MLKLKNIIPLVVLTIAGALSVFAFAPFNRGIFVIISFFALLWYGREFSLKRNLIGGIVFGISYFLAQLYWMFYSLYSVIGIGFLNSAGGMLGFVFFLSLYFVLALFLFKYLATNSPEFNYLILFPSCWVLTEWLRGWVFTGFSWSDIAYTQVHNFLMQGFFPLIGSYGVSWLTMSVIGFLFIVILNHKILTTNKPQITKSNRIAIVYFIVLAISGYYLNGKIYTEAYGKPTKVALIQGNINGGDKWDTNSFLTHLDMYASMISRSKADIIILPETAIPMFEKFLPAHYVEDIVNLAKLNHAELVVGLPREINSNGDYVNSATVFTQDNHPYYAKSHLVPFGEYIPLKDLWGRFYIFAGIPMVGFSAGNENQAPLVLANQKVAFNICYENGFGSELIKNASEATLMANLSDMVWYGQSIAEDQHLQLSQARALENQRYFIQDTNSGLTAIIDPWGKVITSLKPFQKNILVDYVQGRIGVTPYQKYGNYPIITFSALMLLLAFGVKMFFARHKHS